jgi:hypothetical protein
MSDLRTTAGVLEWQANAPTVERTTFKNGVIDTFTRTGTDTATAARIAENERLRQAYDAFRFSAITEESTDVLFRLFGVMNAALAEPKCTCADTTQYRIPGYECSVCSNRRELKGSKP